MKETVRKHIIEWVEDNIYSLTGIDELVQEVGYSRRTIETWFKQWYKQSVGEYMLKRRISRAAILLRMTSLPITEIAFQFHYHSSQGFARSFKKITGLTPSEYRKTKAWDFNKLQPSLLLENHEIPEVKICELAENLSYTDIITEHDHIFDPVAKDVTKAIRKVLLNSHGTIKEMAILGRRPEALIKSRENIAEVFIAYYSDNNPGNSESTCSFFGKYAMMNFEGDWETYSAYIKMIYLWVMAQNKLILRNEAHLFKLHSYSEEKICFDMFIPVE
ncbi:helix-turn-helix transcriptional regulator [Atlantibacter sp.]|uniref:helix-turn-helix transcriptional regulator n=1 Tax=Atlantibacter sp. TaxID=1903473 RepID=UPI0013EF802F|nr:AraC family transcriptional regulator [Atlantibacter sp.]